MVAGPLVNAVANLLCCAPYQLRRRSVTQPETLDRIHEFIKRKRIRTTHLRDGRNREVCLHHLTMQGASQLPAYGGYLRVTVQQHMYARHRLTLRYHYLPCVAEMTKEGHYNYFPWEVLSIDDDISKVTSWYLHSRFIPHTNHRDKPLDRVYRLRLSGSRVRISWIVALYRRFHICWRGSCDIPK